MKFTSISGYMTSTRSKWYQWWVKLLRRTGSHTSTSWRVSDSFLLRWVSSLSPFSPGSTPFPLPFLFSSFWLQWGSG